MVSAKLRAQALPPKKRKKQAPRAPETADEFLAAGVEEEEGGEKWRAGDIVKSSRFFTRALEHYQHGLQKHPQNSDLAYNRARLLYDVCQRPRLLAAFQITANADGQDLLQLALDHHEYAMRLKGDDADLVFNVGQLYRDMAEREQEGQNEATALELLQRAFQAFSVCGELQIATMQRQSQDHIPEVPPQQTDDAATTETMADEAGEAVEDDQWATVVEPVTPASIYDTATVALECVTTIVSIYASGSSLDGSSLAKYNADGERLIGQLQELAEAAREIDDWPEEHPSWERDLLAANLRTTFQDGLCRQGNVSVRDYSLFLLNAFRRGDVLEDLPAQWLADTAEADINLNSTLAQRVQEAPSSQELTNLATFRWKHLTRALNSLTALSKLGLETTAGINLSLSAVHARRAETELLRRRLGEPANGELNANSRNVLASNAEKFFRGARQLAEQTGEDSVDLYCRETIANRLAGGQQALPGQLRAADLERNLAEMVDETLISKAEAQVLAA